ncbi:hypothetical protein N2152v2_010934 [Parachlorella kessleri]
MLRRFSTSPAARQAAGSLEAQYDIFDGVLKALHRDRAARQPLEPDPLLDEVAERLVERLEDCTRKFPSALILGGAGAQVEYLDTSQGMLERAKSFLTASNGSSSSGGIRGGGNGDGGGSEHRQLPETKFTHCDPSSEVLPVAEKVYDVVISCLGLHWANDVPGVMAQCQRALKPDGLFLAAMLGGNTLQELRIACTIAQQEREGGVSPRVSPLAQVRDAGNLLTRAGLAIPTVDVDDIQVQYRDPVQLISHLRYMAESNALLKRQPTLRRDTALAAAAAYSALFQEEVGSIPASFQVIYMTGWAPDPSQRRAAKRGTATVSFEDIAGQLGSDNPQATLDGQPGQPPGGT